MTAPPQLFTSSTPVPPWWQSEASAIQLELEQCVSTGHVRTLSISPGGHPVHAVCYGEPEPEHKGTANFNSALGAGDPEAYYRRSSRRKPVLLIIGGIHGHEVEGIVSALSVIRLLETGVDLAGQPQANLLDKLRGLRVIVIPLANPDGRERVPYRGWSGIPQEEMTRWGQGTRSNGELYRWQPCKAVHPMKGDVGILGAYFDNNGVNMMHDDWAEPMSATTRALLKLTAEEAPDCLINLHSYSSAPGVLPTTFVPRCIEERIDAFTAVLYERLDARGHSHAQLPSTLSGVLSSNNARPPLTLQSMLHHVGAELPVLFESPHGVVSPTAAPFGYEAILDVHHLLFETAADVLLADKAIRGPVNS